MCIYHMMSQQNIREYNFKKWYLRPIGQMLDINLASDERDYDEEVIFSNKLIGQDDGNRLPIYFDLNNSGSSQQFNINYGDFISANTLVSLNYYNPNNEDISCFSSNTLCDIGLTGIDNGLVPEMSGESINFTMGLYTGLTKWDRYHYDRRFKMISITGYTQTPINLILDVIVTPGSVVLNYNLFSNLVLSNDVSLTFTTVLGLITGGSVSFMTGVTINSGNNSGNTSVILNENFGDFDRTLIISGVSSTDESMDYIITVNSEFEFATPTPTPTVTPTVTPTQTNTPTNTETPTNTPTQTQTITPTSSITPSNTNTQTPTNTPTNTSTNTQTPSNTPTNTPSSSPSGGGIVSDNLFMELEGSDYSGSGQWLDRTVNGNNGTVNGATYLPDYGGVFDFNGINNTISVAHTSNLSLSTTQQRTVQVWVRFDEIPALNTQIPVFGKLSSLSGFDGYWGGLFSNGGVVRVTTNGTGTQKVSDSTLTINSNIWYLFTFISQITSALNTTKVYINETEYISTQHGSDTYNESNPFYLGFIGSGVGSLYLNGKIGACYFYTKGLNTSEISQNYNNTKNKYL